MEKTYRIVLLCSGLYRVDRRDRFLFVPFWNTKVKRRLLGSQGYEQPMLFLKKKEAKKYIKEQKKRFRDKKHKEINEKVVKVIKIM